MSFDSLRPSLTSQAVHPGQDAHDDRKPDARQTGKPKQQRKGGQAQPGAHPVVNALGQVIGQAIDLVA